MIELGLIILNYCDEVDEALKIILYKCLKEICNRGELDLSFIGFDYSYRNKLKIKNSL